MSETGDLSQILAFFQSKPGPLPGDGEYDAALCGRIMAAAAAQAASIWRLDDRGVLHLVHGTNLDAAQVAGTTLAVREDIRHGEGITGASVLSRQAIAVCDAQLTPQHDRRIDEQIGFVTHSMISAPIVFGGAVYGALNILNHASGAAFPAEWKERLAAVGVLYGAALAAAGRTKAPGAPAREKSSRRAGSASTASQTTIVGISPAIREALRLCRKVAASDVSVVICGETGTGKELAARRIHEESARAAKPFVEVNCAALPETLLESELFGHVKGAFTGAERDRQGRFLAAKGGTLFLDEISEMSPACQAKILRALQEKKITPVGSEEEIECDVRILAATNDDLWSLVQEGRFREDLYFRLCAIEIEMPALSQRTEDVPLLAQYFLDQARADKKRRALSADGPRLSPEAMEMLCSLPWPGNVRQLREALLAALAICESGEITPADFPASLHKTMTWSGREARRPNRLRQARRAPPMAESDERQSEERKPYIQALESTKYPGTGRYNLAAAARLSGIPRKTFAFRLKKLGIIASGSPR